MTAVVIPCLNRVDLTRACIASLAEHTPDVDVVLVDNASTDATCDLPAAVRNPVNFGFARACNQGAKATDAEVVVFLNNDTEVTEGWLNPLLEALDDPSVGIAGSKLLYPHGGVQHAGVGVDLSRQPGLEAWNITDDWATDNQQVDAVTGACLAVRRDTFAALGGFDEGYWNGYEDVDLCLTALAAGLSNVYVPASVVIHHESASGPARWSKVAENVHRLRTKWGAA